MHVPIHREVVEISPLVQDILSIVQPLSQKKSQELIVHVPDSVVLLSIDPVQITDALVNVLDNAVKYTNEKGKIEFEVTVRDDQAVFRIKDNGPGIPKELLPRIFERFYRVDKARSREQGGTGLGLSIVKHIVQGHGGRAWAKSELGHGATFYFTLPQEPAQP